MSKRYQTILTTPELRRALEILQEFDGYEIDRARQEARWNAEKWKLAMTLVLTSNELERFE